MPLWVKVVGGFFALEGAANLVYWWNQPYDPGEKIWHWVWMAGRFARTILGVALIVLG